MSEETVSYECANCGEKLSLGIKSCPKCGSNRKKIKRTLKETLGIRMEIRGKVKNGKSRKIASKFLKRQKLSKHGKEAIEELHINIKGNRKVHSVKERGENDSWKTVHHEDTPLKKKQN